MEALVVSINRTTWSIKHEVTSIVGQLEPSEPGEPSLATRWSCLSRQSHVQFPTMIPAWFCIFSCNELESVFRNGCMKNMEGLRKKGERDLLLKKRSEWMWDETWGMIENRWADGVVYTQTYRKSTLSWKEFWRIEILMIDARPRV